jgi:hypothetical protein
VAAQGLLSRYAPHIREAIDLLTACAPTLEQAVAQIGRRLAYAILDGTLIRSTGFPAVLTAATSRASIAVTGARSEGRPHPRHHHRTDPHCGGHPR